MKNYKKVTTISSLAIAMLVILGFGQNMLQESAVAVNNDRMVPAYEVDPFWPQPLPNKWILGRAIGVATDARDHIYIVHRDQNSMFMNQEIGLTLGRAQCCSAAPPILEFDINGNLINAWGGPTETGEYVWPESNHGIDVAPNGDLWIGGNGGGDSHVLVFTRSGEYVRTVGLPGNDVDSNSETHYARVAEIGIDEINNEAYLADGYGNRRVAVVDLATGAFKRYWGAYGNRPDDDAENTYIPGEPLPTQFRGPVHCAEPSNDGLVYVCDRGADRIQVFRTDGTFVKEGQVNPLTLAGTTWDLTFSRDDDQEFIFLANGGDFKIHILDRDTLEVLYEFGEGGRQPGTFFAPHSIVSDSENNLYTTETYEGKRLQKFVFQGMRPLESIRNGQVPWPADALNN